MKTRSARASGALAVLAASASGLPAVAESVAPVPGGSGGGGSLTIEEEEEIRRQIESGNVLANVSREDLAESTGTAHLESVTVVDDDESGSEDQDGEPTHSDKVRRKPKSSKKKKSKKSKSVSVSQQLQTEEGGTNPPGKKKASPSQIFPSPENDWEYEVFGDVALWDSIFATHSDPEETA